MVSFASVRFTSRLLQAGSEVVSAVWRERSSAALSTNHILINQKKDSIFNSLGNYSRYLSMPILSM